MTIILHLTHVKFRKTVLASKNSNKYLKCRNFPEKSTKTKKNTMTKVGSVELAAI